jgi:glutathione S-transferase
MMPDLQIIGAAFSNYVWAVRIACTEKRVPYTLTPAMPHTPEVGAIHPLGKIPVMRYGDVTLAESRAICFYIERMFDGPPLVPPDPVKASQVEQWISIVNTSIDPVWMRQYVLAYAFPGTEDGSPDRARIDAALPKMEKLFAVMDEAVKSGFLVGTSFTLADINFLPILYYTTRRPEGAALLSKHRALKAYLDRHMARKSVQETMPQTAGAKPAEPVAKPPAAEGGQTQDIHTESADNAS